MTAIHFIEALILLSLSAASLIVACCFVGAGPQRIHPRDKVRDKFAERLGVELDHGGEE